MMIVWIFFILFWSTSGHKTQLETLEILKKMASNITYKWEVHDNGNIPNAKETLVDWHLNFDAMYDAVNDIITHKDYWFHTQQIHQSVAQCHNSKYNE
jgi:hypothetical protein